MARDRIELPTRGFSVLLSYRDYVTLSVVYVYLFKRLMAVFGGSFYRFEHIVSYS